MIQTSIERCSTLAGTHISRAFRNTLDHSMPPGYTPLAGGGTLLIAGGQHPMCNSAVGVLDNEIEFCMERLVACGEPSMITFTNPTASDKESVLLDAGFVASPPSPALTVEIEKLPRITCPPGYRFQRVSPDQDPEKWISLP